MNDHLPAERDLPRAAHQLRREHLMSEITEPGRRRVLRRGRWITGVSLAVVLTGGGAAVAASLMGGERVEQALGTGCYDRASLDADTTVIGDGGLDPVSACAELWSKGEVGDAEPPVPPLVACTQGKSVGVFPGDARTCAKLGLTAARPLTAAEKAEARALITVRKKLADQTGRRCLPEKEALTTAQSLLASHGLKGWRVVAEGFGSGKPADCAMVGILDVKTKTLPLQADPRP
ncbi:hypothetical protein [Spirillospora sp. CA-294931]|uniref:hypothetical protein n=1 Tax=Spirillospora sp. CA-294931 TaxID=3240042 RepID=UPI003D8AD7CD